MTVLGVDPGSHKTGLAVLDDGGRVLHQSIEPSAGLAAAAAVLAGRFQLRAIAMGCGTNAGPLEAELRFLGVPIQLVDERETTLRARALFFADHPPTGWRRLVPLGMQLPSRPVDDYAAILIARRFLTEGGNPAPS